MKYIKGTKVLPSGKIPPIQSLQRGGGGQKA